MNSILLAISWLAVSAMSAAWAGDVTVYIAAQANGPGTGTQTDPFDGSTEAKFDALMKSFPINTRINLGAGTFMTKGFDAFSMKVGWIVQGAGMGVTVLKLAGSPSTTVGKHYHLCGNPCDNVQISNLTCDGNYEGYNWAPHEVVGGVCPFGSNVVIDHVEMINCYGDLTDGSEEFSILIGGPEPLYRASNCVIKNCLTHQYAPGSNYTNGPMISYCNGAKILNCTDDGANHGFGFAGDVGAELQGCTTSRQTGTAFYTDTAGDDQITLDGNSLSSSGIPIQFNSQSPATHVTISNNALESSNSTGCGSAAIVLCGASGTDFTITGNVFTYTGTGNSGFILNNQKFFTDLEVEDNSSNVGLAGAGGGDANITDVGVVQGNDFNQPIASLPPPADSPDAAPVIATTSSSPAPASAPAPAATSTPPAPVPPASAPTSSSADSENVASDSPSMVTDPSPTSPPSPSVTDETPSDDSSDSTKVASSPKSTDMSPASPRNTSSAPSPEVAADKTARENDSLAQLAKQVQDDTDVVLAHDLSREGTFGNRNHLTSGSTTSTSGFVPQAAEGVTPIEPHQRALDKFSMEGHPKTAEYIQPLPGQPENQQSLDPASGIEKN